MAGENSSGERERCALRDRADDVRGINTWYAFGGHVRIERDGRAISPPARAPQPTPPSQPAAPTSERGVRLPGNSSTFYPEPPIFSGSNLTWGEATRNGARIPEHTTVVDNIIAPARELQRARDTIGKPYHITSWYRPAPYNSRAVDPRNSQHLTGKRLTYGFQELSDGKLPTDCLPRGRRGRASTPTCRRSCTSTAAPSDRGAFDTIPLYVLYPAYTPLVTKCNLEREMPARHRDITCKPLPPCHTQALIDPNPSQTP